MNKMDVSIIGEHAYARPNPLKQRKLVIEER